MKNPVKALAALVVLTGLSACSQDGAQPWFTSDVLSVFHNGLEQDDEGGLYALNAIEVASERLLKDVSVEVKAIGGDNEGTLGSSHVSGPDGGAARLVADPITFSRPVRPVELEHVEVVVMATFAAGETSTVKRRIGPVLLGR